MSSLKEAERKLKENGFLFDDLPEDRSDPFWNHFMNDPYNLKLNEVCALKNARCKLPGIQEVPTRCSSLTKSENGSPETLSSLSDEILSADSILLLNEDDVAKTAVADDETSTTFTVSTATMSARPKKTLQKKDFENYLLEIWPPAKLVLYLEANFPSFSRIKKDYLDKISDAAKKTKSNGVDVRFEDIADHVPFLSSTIKPIIEEIMSGVHIMREKRAKSKAVSEPDNLHRVGFIRFIQVVWQGLDFDPEGYGYFLQENAQVVEGWYPDQVRNATANYIWLNLFGTMQSITFSERKVVFPTVEDVRKVISIFAKSLRKSISRRTGKRADVVAEASGIDKKNLDKMKLAKQLKPTMNNGKKGILCFNSTELTRFYQSTGGFKAAEKAIVEKKLDSGSSDPFEENDENDDPFIDEDESSTLMALQSGDDKQQRTKNKRDDDMDSSDDVVVLPVIVKKKSKKPRVGEEISANFT